MQILRNHQPLGEQLMPGKVIPRLECDFACNYWVTLKLQLTVSALRGGGGRWTGGKHLRNFPYYPFICSSIGWNHVHSLLIWQNTVF